MKTFRKILLKQPNIKFNEIPYTKLELLLAEGQIDRQTVKLFFVVLWIFLSNVLKITLKEFTFLIKYRSCRHNLEVCKIVSLVSSLVVR